MKKIRLAAVALAMTGCVVASAVLSPESPLTKARAGTAAEAAARISQTSAERHQARPVADTRLRSQEYGMAAPEAPAMRAADASGANLFGSVISDESFVSIAAGDNISLNTLATFKNNLIPNGGAVLMGDKYLACEYDQGSTSATCYISI